MSNVIDFCAYKARREAEAGILVEEMDPDDMAWCCDECGAPIPWDEFIWNGLCGHCTEVFT